MAERTRLRREQEKAAVLQNNPAALARREKRVKRRRQNKRAIHKAKIAAYGAAQEAVATLAQQLDAALDDKDVAAGDASSSEGSMEVTDAGAASSSFTGAAGASSSSRAGGAQEPQDVERAMSEIVAEAEQIFDEE